MEVSNKIELDLDNEMATEIINTCTLIGCQPNEYFAKAMMLIKHIAEAEAKGYVITAVDKSGKKRQEYSIMPQNAKKVLN